VLESGVRWPNPFSRLQHPGKRAFSVASAAAADHYKQLDDAISSSQVTALARPLYLELCFGSGFTFADIVRRQPFVDDLARLKYAGDYAARFAFNLLICQQLWIVKLAFNSDHNISKYLGQDWSNFVLNFLKITEIDHGVFINVDTKSDAALNSSSGNIEVATDLQLFQFIQALTGEAYTPDHWRRSSLIQLGSTAALIRKQRLLGIKRAKEQMGLPGVLLDHQSVMGSDEA
jgi:hypothetical protein